MRALSSKAGSGILMMILAAGLASGGEGVGPLFGFAPADSTGWRPDTLALAFAVGESRVDSLYLINEGSESTGPLTIQFLSDFHSAGGGSVPQGDIIVSPPAIDSLSAGEERLVTLNIHLSPTTPPAVYHATLAARRSTLGTFDEVVIELHVLGRERLRVVPNPVYEERHAGADFRIATEAGLSVTLDIYTLGMEKVRTLRSPGAYTGTSVDELRWDLCNDFGRGVASGMYLVLARYDLLGVESTEIHRVMVIY